MAQRSFARTPDSYVEKQYRRVSEAANLISSYVKIEDTDLHILADISVGDIELIGID